jgi:hypothetical protein
MEVVSTTGNVRLGKVEDLIIALNSDRAPFAIVRYGGVLGIAGTKVAVPFHELTLTADNKELTLAATEEEFTSASTSPSGAWAAVADQDWAKNVDRYYGQPDRELSRFERQGLEEGRQGHEFVRESSDHGQAGKPADSEITTKVNKVIDNHLGASARQNIQVTVANGVVTLKGKVANAQDQRMLDETLKSLKGVDRVDDQLSLSTE